jgi:monothiol glutaredoxin
MQTQTDSAKSFSAEAPAGFAARRLDAARVAAEAQRRMTDFHPDVVREVEEAVGRTAVVVVGMAQNPHVKNVRTALTDAGVAFTYLEYGSYFSKWRDRLAIKLWSGWPTFPQVFVRGVLIGGEDLTKAALADGSLVRAANGAAAGAP